LALQGEYISKDWKRGPNLCSLGNNRIFFSDTNGNGFVSMSEVSQEAHYYPFGMTMQGSWLSTSMPKNKYRHNGIEQTASASGTKYRIPKLKLFFG
jgi:hypothetical protein